MANQKKLTLLVTGANGQLGRCLRDLAPTIRHKFIFTDIEELDITNKNAVQEIFDKEKPDWIINCAAYTAVDKAENDKENAQLINVDAVKILSEVSAAHCCGIVHISTDYVYKGDNPTPLTENETPAPLSVYGLTKLEGEKYAAINPKHIILRTSWLYSPYGNNFVKTMLSLGSSRSSINVVSDQWGSPTSAADLARGILVALERPKYGTYHFSNEGCTNWALFAEEIMLYADLECKINHIDSSEYPSVATRPTYSILDKSLFTKTFGSSIPEWELSLEDVVHQLV